MLEGTLPELLDRVASTNGRPVVNATHVADSRKDKGANCIKVRGTFSTSLEKSSVNYNFDINGEN